MAQIRKFALSGFSRADEASFSSLFNAVAARAGGRFELSAEVDADALIIDADSIYGQMGLMQAQASGKLLIAITAGSRADADHKLDSPVTEAALASLLSRLSGEASRAAPPTSPEAAASPTPTPPARTAPAESRPAPAASTPPAAPAKASYEAAPTKPPAQTAAAVAASVPAPNRSVSAPAEPTRNRSLFELLQPGVLQQPVRLQRGTAPALIIDPASRTYLGVNTLKPYAEYVKSAIRDSELKPVTAAELQRLEGELGAPQPIQRLLWLAALHAGEGQVIGFDPAARFKLGKWPQIEREFPKHFRIATAMMKAPASVDEIAAASGASREEVCDLLNAYLTIGFAEPEQAQASATETAGNSLLNRLRGLRG
jgi:hypothetical protein